MEQATITDKKISKIAFVLDNIEAYDVLMAHLPMDTKAYLIDAADEIQPEWIEGKQCIGVTAGASAPDVLVQGVLQRLRELGANGLKELDGEPESMVFALPKELRVRLVD